MIIKIKIWITLVNYIGGRFTNNNNNNKKQLVRKMAVLSLWFTLLWANLLGPGHEGKTNSLFLSLSQQNNLYCFILSITGLNNKNFAML